MNKRILARKGNKFLVHQEVKLEIAGTIFKREEYVVWEDQEKMNQDIAAEIIGNEYRVYCYFLSYSEIEIEIVNSFFEN